MSSAVITRRAGIGAMSVLFAAALCVLLPVSALADVSFAGENRFVMLAEQPRKAVTVVNREARENLVKIELDWGDGRQGDTPVVVTQPLLMMGAGGQKSFDVIYAGEGLPTDRESYFLLSVLEIPPVPKQANVLQITPRHRMKLFFRPKLAVDVRQVPNEIKWTLTEGEPSTIELDNPSPYYVTFTDLELVSSDSARCGSAVEHLMLAPFSNQHVTFVGCRGNASRVRYQIISDEGRPRSFEAQLQAGAPVIGLSSS